MFELLAQQEFPYTVQLRTLLTLLTLQTVPLLWVLASICEMRELRGK